VSAPVLILLVDGLRPEALAESHCPAMKGLMEGGASTRAASSVMPTMTLPCHLSLALSVPPERHGVLTNEWRPPDCSHPGLFEVACAQGLRASMVYNWGPLRYMAGPESLSFSLFRSDLLRPDGDDAIAEAAARHLERDLPDLAFVYLGTVDVAGHDHGFLSARYLEQVERVDRAVEKVLGAFDPSGHVLFQSDHGGHDYTHGFDCPEDVLIPWALRGPKARGAHSLIAPVSLLDTAPTVAHLLGIPAPEEWAGQVVAEAFGEDLA
jgi:predicted AlkP superfamily pyrophosphatase or phosphodiesterase